MAELSDNLLIATVMLYLLAMLLHAAGYAFGRQGAVAKAVQVPELVSVGAGTAEVTPSPAESHVEAPTRPADRSGWMTRAALLVTVAAALVHLGTAVTRAIAADRMPWGNMYEFVLSATLIGTVAWLVTARLAPPLRHLGLFVALTELLLTGLAGMVLHTPVGPLMPALDSYWFVIHIAAVVSASGLFLVGFVASVMYLLRSGYDKGRRGGLYPFAAQLPKADVVERLSFRLHAFGFPIWTFGVAAGAIWAEAAWGRYWGWDPKETWAFISWIVYAGYLHARATPSVKRSTAAWLALLGWATMMMNLFGVNFFIDGLHSYADVD